MEQRSSLDAFMSAALSAASPFFQCGNAGQALPLPVQQSQTDLQPSLVATPGPMHNERAAAAGDCAAGAAHQQMMTRLQEPEATETADVNCAVSAASDATFDSLPNEVAEKIFAHLQPADLKYARLVSR